MVHYFDQYYTDTGKPAAGATVSVKIAGTTIPAVLFSDDGVTPKSNPFTANALGQLDFYVADGHYDITLTGANITPYTFFNKEIASLFTAADPQSGGFWGVTIVPT